MLAITRKYLPERRRCVTQKVSITDAAGRRTTVHFAVGYYPDGTPGELFIDMHKQGAALRDWSSQTAMLFSIAIQHCCPLATALELFIGSRSDPSGAVTGHARITRCTSVMDLIARSLAVEFLGREDLADRDAPAPNAGEAP